MERLINFSRSPLTPALQKSSKDGVFFTTEHGGPDNIGT
jgi:hypothetical protein